jgi:hypothetical protein
VKTIHSSLLVATLYGVLASCSQRTIEERERVLPTGFAALADTASPPSRRDSALAQAPLDSNRCNYIEGAFNVPDAMELIYGLYDQDIECSKWLCHPRERRTFSEKQSRSGHLFTRAAGQYQIKEGGDQKILLLTETLARDRSGWEDCHACAPILGAAMFSQIDGAWFIETLKKDIAEIGAWGVLPPNKMIAIGPQDWGVRFDYDYTAQGTTIGGMALMAKVDGQFGIVADVHTKFSNEEMFLEGEGDDLKYHYDSELNWVAGDNTKIQDMHVHTTGKRPLDGLDGSGKIVRFDETRIYTFKSNQYVLYDSTLLAM